MYPISNALKEAFESNAKQYARITVGNTVIDNSRIRLGSFSVNRYALAEDTVVFGSCVAAEFNVTLENGDGAFSTGTFLGQEAFVEVGCDINGTVQYVPIGYFKFDMVTAQASTLKLSALDRMMSFESNVNPTPYSVSGTVSALIDSVCTACGVARGTFTLPVNGTVTLSGEVSDVKTYRDVLRWIGEVTGTIAYIGYDGKLYFGWYSGTDDFDITTSNRMQSSISNDATTITSVSIVQGENMVTAGTGAKIVIRDNALIPLASATAQTIANNLYNHVNGFTYRTFEAGVFPMPHIAPLDCGVYSDLDGNDYSVCCTDWTFTLNANTKIAGKGGKQAYGRGYTLDESVFTARNIAAGAVTAEKINVQDLAALNATIGGFSIGSDRIVHYYKDNENNEYYLRIMSPIYGASTQGIEVLVKPNGGSWDNAFAVKYNGWMMSKNCDIEGIVKATSGLIGNISISNGAIESLNGNFKVNAAGNLECTGGTIGGWDITSTTISKTQGVSDYDEFVMSSTGMCIIITHPTGGTYEGREEALQTEISEGTVKVTHGVMATGGVFGGYEFATLGGTELEIHNYDYEFGGSNPKQGRFGFDKLIVANRDILRTHQSLVGGYGTQIVANKNLNTTEFLEVRRFFCPMDSTVATLTNCPTGNAFMMEVFAPISATIDDESASSGSRYRVRVIMTWQGRIYVQNCYFGSSGWFYGEWRKVLDSLAEEGNSAVWLKAQVGRQSSIDNLTRTYADSRVHMRLDIVSSSLSSSPFDGDGYLLTFFWDSAEMWDTQIFFPNGGGTPSIRKRRNNTSWEAAIKFVTTAVEKNTYSNTSVKRGECIARRQGNVVTLNCAGDAVSIPAATVTDYVTVAAKYAPSEIMYVNLANNPAQGKFAIVSPNGKVQLYSASAITSAQNFAFSVTYIVD